MEQVHEGHRNRMRERFATNAFEGFAEHEVLEVALFGAIPRGNTNPIAHELINRFGSFAKVCDAPIEELMKVNGIGRSSAIQIKMIPEFCKYYLLSSQQNTFSGPLTNSDAVIEYLKPYFVGKTNEALFLLSLDNMSRPIECTLVSEGAVNATRVDMRKITELVVKLHASAVILAHNHPDGYAFPSQEDIITTKRVRDHLKTIGVSLLDHIIYTPNEMLSMAESGFQMSK